jgi:hypothetical protein
MAKAPATSAAAPKERLPLKNYFSFHLPSAYDARKNRHNNTFTHSP